MLALYLYIVSSSLYPILDLTRGRKRMVRPSEAPGKFVPEAPGNHLPTTNLNHVQSARSTVSKSTCPITRRPVHLQQIMSHIILITAIRNDNRLADRFQFVDNLFLLDSSVLKPYRDLPLRQVGLGRYPPPFVLRDEFIGGVLSLELLQLHLGVWHALLSPAPERADVSCCVGHCV